jgi:hypothetical protein
MEHAACRQLPPPRRYVDDDGNAKVTQDPFFPDRGESYVEAVKICFNCGVRPQCKEYKQRIGAEYGVWAGAIERRQD